MLPPKPPPLPEKEGPKRGGGGARKIKPKLRFFYSTSSRFQSFFHSRPGRAPPPVVPLALPGVEGHVFFLPIAATAILAEWPFPPSDNFCPQGPHLPPPIGKPLRGKGPHPLAVKRYSAPRKELAPGLVPLCPDPLGGDPFARTPIQPGNCRKSITSVFFFPPLRDAKQRASGAGLGPAEHSRPAVQP